MNLAQSLQNKKLLKQQQDRYAEIAENLNKLQSYPEWRSLEFAIKSLAVAIVQRLATEDNTDRIKQLQTELRIIQTIIDIPDLYSYATITGEQQEEVLD